MKKHLSVHKQPCNQPVEENEPTEATETISSDALATVSDANDRLPVVCNLFDWLQSRVISDTTEQSAHFWHYTGLDVCCLMSTKYQTSLSFKKEFFSIWQYADADIRMSDGVSQMRTRRG